jgi:hypothetical protein
MKLRLALNFNTRKAGTKIGGENALEKRGAADCEQPRQAAGELLGKTQS